MQEKAEQNNTKTAMWVIKRQHQTKPCPCNFENRAAAPERQAIRLALRRDIQAVVLQQSKDQPNQFSGS
jgi:hypothetical protein